MNPSSEGLIQLLTAKPDGSSDTRIVMIGSDRIAAHGSIREAILAETIPNPPVDAPLVVVIDRHFAFLGFFPLSLRLRSPNWIANAVANSMDMKVASHYLVWPSTNGARFAFDTHQPRSDIRWATTNGVLGGSARWSLRQTWLYREYVYRTSSLVIHLVPDVGASDR